MTMVKSHEHDLYYVESIWPCTHDENHKEPCGMYRNDPWRRYSTSAFNDKRKPNKQRDGYGHANGSFDRENMDVSEKRMATSPKTGFLIEHPVFEREDDALAYAERLAKYGELASKYDNMGHIPNWKKNHSRKIRTRVVRERTATIVTSIKEF